MKCTRKPARSCASLPRRRASAAEVAELREDIAALDRCARGADEIGELALGRANTLGRVLAEHLTADEPEAAAAGDCRWPSLRVLPGGVA